MSGAEFTVVEIERQPGDPASLVARTDKIRVLTDWQPRFNNLETIVTDAWRCRMQIGREITAP